MSEFCYERLDVIPSGAAVLFSLTASWALARLRLWPSHVRSYHCPIPREYWYLHTLSADLGQLLQSVTCNHWLVLCMGPYRTVWAGRSAIPTDAVHVSDGWKLDDQPLEVLLTTGEAQNQIGKHIVLCSQPG